MIHVGIILLSKYYSNIYWALDKIMKYRCFSDFFTHEVLFLFPC